MALDKDRHVVPNPQGGWDVIAPGAKRPSSHHATQADAERAARTLVRKNGGGEVRVHGQDGGLQGPDSMAPAREPNPPRDAVG
jgi:hypothetical protein